MCQRLLPCAVIDSVVEGGRMDCDASPFMPSIAMLEAGFLKKLVVSICLASDNSILQASSLWSTSAHRKLFNQPLECEADSDSTTVCQGQSKVRI